MYETNDITEPTIEEFDIKYTCKTIATALFMMMLIQLVVIFIGAAIIGVNASFLSLKATAALSMVSTVLSSLFVMYRYGRKLSIQLFASKEDGSWGIKKILFFSLITIGFSGFFTLGVNLLNMLFQQTGFVMTTPDFSFSFSMEYNIILLVSTCIIAPIFEELIYRGLILHALKRFGIHFAVFATSLLFALAHGNFIQGIPTFFMSLLLCYMVLESGSIITGMIAHFLNNALGMVETFFLGNQTMSIIFLIVEVFLMILAMYYLLKHREVFTTIKKQSGDHGTFTFFNNWVSILYLILIVISYLGSIMLL